ncbi:MAG: metalloregulator ArsR/SmtB family transcription factor [Firmicutes bacterium]|nr:metalloregulator ArsR/SmtB family transcription factor [Bacillota bacterium]MDD4264126.1 metalloregulator ArsR/SmtB family transcription factor [Bacillota bacterium]MDD4694158.1 metalloregulator ArsR/SmtB family transcription factor [Bacillota bacterium]
MTEDICCNYEPTGPYDEIKKDLEVIESLAEIFKILGDETRVKILYILSQKELCVCDIADILGMNMPAVSNHLRILRALRLVNYRKQGRSVYYSLDDNHIVDLINIAREHFLEE